MRVGLLSDTHGFLDEVIFEHFAECDEVWHAGDFGPVEILDQLKVFKPLRGVYGNVDGAAVRSEVNDELSWTCEGVRVYMTHIGGYPGHYEKKAKQAILREGPDLFICGHSHILRVIRDAQLNLVHMNPGACGHHGWHKVRTLLRFTLAAGAVSGVEAIELGPRGRTPRPTPNTGKIGS